MRRLFAVLPFLVLLALTLSGGASAAAKLQPTAPP
jgi:hypothetical protein